MNTTRQKSGRPWWSRAVMFGGLLSVGLPLIAALGTRFGVWNFKLGLLIWAIGFLIALVGVIGGFIAVIGVVRRNRVAERASVFLGTTLAALVVGFLGSQFIAARGVPPIHDISTDTSDPPSYDAAVKLRGDGPDTNTLVYDAQNLPAQQRAAYPNVVPLDVTAPPAAAFDAAVAALNGLGFEVVNADPQALRVEAVATSFWFGFKDDVVVRIRPTDSGSRIDVRSVSRVGVGDTGVNAKRIVKILDAIKTKTA